MSTEKPIFFPLLDNGGGAIRSNFQASCMSALSGRRVHLHQSSDSLAGRGRNKITAEFLLSECDEMLMIDGDILFTAEDIANLFSHDLPLVFGLYPKRQPDLEWCLCTMEGHVPDASAVLVELRRAGTGFVRIHRSVFEAMKEDNGGPCRKYHNHGRDEWEFWPVGVVDPPLGLPGEYLSEDWYFCENSRKLGIKVMADQRIRCRHEGFVVFPLPYAYEAAALKQKFGATIGDAIEHYMGHLAAKAKELETW